MTNIGATFAANLQLERELSPRDDDGKPLTDRDIERMTAALGDRIVYTTARRIRLDSRTRGLTVDEWLMLSLALSVPPLDLLGSEPVKVGGEEHEADRVRRWITGESPLSTVPDPTAHRWSGVKRITERAGKAEPSHLAQRLVDAGRRVDGEDAAGQRRVLVSLLGTIAGALGALEQKNIADRIDERAEKGGK